MIRTSSIGTLALLLFLFTAEPASGQQIVGSGGDAIRCSSGARLLDFFVGETYLGLSPRLGHRSEVVYQVRPQDAAAFVELQSVLPIVEFWLAALEDLDPIRVAQLREQLRTFPGQWSLVSGQTFRDIKDEGPLDIPDDCELVQAGIQTRPSTPLERRFMVSSEVWSSLASIDKAGLILHELLYFDALRRGHDTSYYVRQMTALISDSERLVSLTREDYRAWVTDLFFTSFRTVDRAFPWVYETIWVYYQEPIESAQQAIRTCHERLGPQANAGFSKWGARSLSNRRDSAVVMAVHAQEYPLYFWNRTMHEEDELWSFDGWYTRQREPDAAIAELLCSYTR